MNARRLLVVTALIGSMALGTNAAATTPPLDPGVPFESGEWTGTRFRIIGGPDWLAADDRYVYVRRDDQHVEVLDPMTGQTIRSIPVAGDICQGIGAAFGSVWTCSGRDVVRIDPDLGDTIATIAADKIAQQGHIVGAFDRVWVLTGDGTTLAAIDPDTNALDAEIVLPSRCTDLSADEASLWVACSTADLVVAVDPDSGSVTAEISVVEPLRVAFATDAIWLGAVGSVVRLDPETQDPVAAIEGGTGRAGGIAADDAGVWVRRANAPLRRIDPATNAVTDELDLGVGSGGDVLVAYGAVWTTAADDAALFRIASGQPSA